MDDLISRQAALVSVKDALLAWSYMPEWRDEKIMDALADVPSAQPKPDKNPHPEQPDSDRLGVKTWETCSDTISRQNVLRCLTDISYNQCKTQGETDVIDIANTMVITMPSAQPDKEMAKRVLWSGWKGCRNTRYKCPTCKKPVKNDDVYCHRCGQKLMFPHIDHTLYVPGEKQELIVRWDDE